MKTFLLYLAVALLAALIVLYQPFAVFGADDFTMTPEGYKVFRYGFPFRIIDCNERLPIHMSGAQIALRFFGNFAVFFVPGALMILAIRRFRHRDRLH